jgi:hypothetical protein
MKYGYARVSTDGQSVDAQVRQLTKAGCKKVFREVASGAKTDRNQLRRLLDQLEAGDVLMVTRLDRLARSTRDLLNTLGTITDRKAGFRSLGDTWARHHDLTRTADDDRARRPCGIRTRSDTSTHWRRPGAGQGTRRENGTQAEDDTASDEGGATPPRGWRADA